MSGREGSLPTQVSSGGRGQAELWGAELGAAQALLCGRSQPGVSHRAVIMAEGNWRKLYKMFFLSSSYEICSGSKLDLPARDAQA